MNQDQNYCPLSRMNNDALKEYANAQIYSQMYDFAHREINLTRGGDSKRVEIINTIQSLDVPPQTKKFMIGVVEDAVKRQPKYYNHFSMVNRNIIA